MRFRSGLVLTLIVPAIVVAQPQFVDVTEQVGINVILGGTTLAGTPQQQQQQRNIGNGGAVGDYDNDGDLDLFLVRGTGRPVLLRNDLVDGVRRFRNVAAAAGVERAGQLRTAAFADLNNDGWLDLLAFGDDTGEGPSGTKVYENNRDGTFTSRIAESNMRPLGQLRCGASLADFDGDGLLDIYVSNWGLHGLVPPSEFSGSNRLFRNLGNFVFQDVTEPVGLGIVARDSFTAIFTDFDDDLRPDLFIAQDHQPDKFYFNRAAGFVDRSIDVNVLHAGNDMGLAAADFDDDGDLDVYATNITDHQGIFGNAIFNVLNVNVGTPAAPVFEDQAVARGIGDTYWGWGAEFTDVDLDGDLDLVVATGYDEFVRAVNEDSPILESPTVLFVNDGTGQFTRVEGGLGAGWDSRGLIAFDYDRDGDEDLLLTNVAQPVRLFENVGADGAGHWLTVTLEQLPGLNRQGIGARVYARIGDRTMRRDILAGESYVSVPPAEAHFGLGGVQSIDELRVLWTDGSETVLADVAVDQRLHIRQLGLCDCDTNGVSDGSQIRAEPNLDGDENGVLDACQSGDWDCNDNGVPDTCEPDCDGNGVPDSCERDPLTDCDGDRILDVCNLARGDQDCNRNGVLDRCEIASGVVLDVDDNGIPDDCELLGGCARGELLGAFEEEFGKAIAYRDGVLVVGAPGTGRVLVYQYLNGAWQLEAELVPPDGAADDRFGTAVATDGRHILVGADWHDALGTNAGAAYLFSRVAGSWTLEAKLLAPDGESTDWFGRAVAVDDGCVIVAAPGANGRNDGVLYEFRSDGGTWLVTQEFAPTTSQRNDNFGTSLSLRGDRLLAGGHKRDQGLDRWDAGGVFVFERNEGAWEEVQELPVPTREASDRFGWSLALEEDLAVVGADRADPQEADAGAVFVYRRQPDGTWSLEQRIHPVHPQRDMRFGHAVAVHDGRIAVGANRASGVGATYLFSRDNGQWRVAAKWADATGDAVGVTPRFVLSSDMTSGIVSVLSLRNSDCDGNGINDNCDLATGTLTDADDDGRADECCEGDFDGSGDVGLTDLALLLAAFAQPPDANGYGDIDGDRDVDLDDLMLLLGRFGFRCE